MNTACTDNDIGTLLHAWELGFLDDRESEQLEVHLLTCDYCFAKASALSDEMLVLDRSSDARDTIRDLCRAKINKKSRSGILGLVALAAVVTIMSIVVYTFLGRGGSNRVSQELRLYPMRSSNGNVIKAETPGAVRIRFVLNGAMAGRAYQVSIVTSDRDTVWSDSQYAGFNSSGLGEVNLPTDSLKPDLYTLEISDPSRPTALQTYHFRAQ